VEFRDELPKTTVGKILRRELVREHKETTGSAPTTEEVIA
jgi:acyl-coenzyme A synthetase/AMP-(fatty) acid ligase